MNVTIKACLLTNEIPNQLSNVNIHEECNVKLDWLLPKTERKYFQCLVYIPKITFLDKNGFKLACIFQIENKFLEFHSKKTRKKLKKLTKYEQILFGVTNYSSNLQVAVYELYPNTIEIS